MWVKQCQCHHSQCHHCCRWDSNHSQMASFYDGFTHIFFVLLSGSWSSKCLIFVSFSETMTFFRCVGFDPFPDRLKQRANMKKEHSLWEFMKIQQQLMASLSSATGGFETSKIWIHLQESLGIGS